MKIYQDNVHTIYYDHSQQSITMCQSCFGYAGLNSPEFAQLERSTNSLELLQTLEFEPNLHIAKLAPSSRNHSMLKQALHSMYGAIPLVHLGCIWLGTQPASPQGYGGTAPHVSEFPLMHFVACHILSCLPHLQV